MPRSIFAACTALCIVIVMSACTGGSSDAARQSGPSTPMPTSTADASTPPPGTVQCEKSSDCTPPLGCDNAKRCDVCAAEGAPCATDFECCDGMGCANGLCTSTCIGASLSWECRTSAECCPLRECRNGHCSGAFCSKLGNDCTTVRCCDENPCIGGKCRRPNDAGIACSNDTCEVRADCCDGKYCVDGTCTTECRAAGVDCTGQGDCCEGLNCHSADITTVGNDRYCSTGACAALGRGCSSREKCCGGTFCDSGTCATCKTAGSSCTDGPEGECCGQQVCYQSTCGACRPDGQSCFLSEDCCPGLSCDLSAQICTGTPCGWTKDPCTTDADCCNFHRCSKGQCLFVDGTNCTDPTTCAGGACIVTCTTCKQDGAACNSNLDCCQGYECPSGTCILKGTGCRPETCSGCTYFGGENCCYRCVGSSCAQTCSF